MNLADLIEKKLRGPARVPGLALVFESRNPGRAPCRRVKEKAVSCFTEAKDHARQEEK
jgi:hypothetical protein